jgi:hypothetical protein
MPLGFGHTDTAYDDFQQGKGVNPNQYRQGIKAIRSVDIHVWWKTPVTLIKA